MICISVTPESRKLAKVDILNAGRQSDMVELCLDRLIKPPDMNDILNVVDKPILVSCRRKEHGGQFQGTEEERLTLLRQAIVAEPEYVELEMDVGLLVPRFGNTKRVISYTTDKPLSNVDDIFEEAAQLNADVVKFTWPTPTLEAAWPLLAAVTKKRKIPVVGIGLGRAGLTFSLLGRKYGSPWIYAALEKGMEGYEGQPTVHELDEIYGWREIGPKTQFVGIVGFGESETMTVRIFNNAFKQFGLNARCLPLAIGSKFERLGKMLEILKIKTLLTSRSLGEHILPLAENREKAAEQGEYADFLLKRDDGWHAYNSILRSAMKALDQTIGEGNGGGTPLEKRNVLVVGTGGLAQTMAYGISKRGGLISITGRDDKAAKELAQKTDARHLSFGTFYGNMCDFVVIADANLTSGQLRGQFNPSYFRSGMTVIDVAHMPQDSKFIAEARRRDCKVVEPKEIYWDQLSMQFKSITGKELPRDAFDEGLAAEF